MIENSVITSYLVTVLFMFLVQTIDDNVKYSWYILTLKETLIAGGMFLSALASSILTLMWIWSL